ncbi:MAG: hypothetical protein JKY44_00555, partial [Flavobacteriaceae bacterium]|nr:hypothetical protein [Flavobacteriaceae bacterium]
MKNSVLSFMLFLVAVCGYAQQGITYKAVIKNGEGTILSSKAITVQFQILQGASQTNVYQETHTTTTDANGLVVIYIGEGTTNSGDFSTIDWGIETSLNTKINTGEGLIYIGTTGFKSVPYAIQAEKANNGMPIVGAEGQVLQIDANGVAVWASVTSSGALFYEDADNDGYGNSNESVFSNFAPNGYVSNNTDCADTDTNEYPGQTWYIDADGDKYGLSSAIVSCLRPVNGFLVSELLGINDCYDADANEYPGQTWYIDADGDKYGLSSAIVSCLRPVNGFLVSELLGIND